MKATCKGCGSAYFFDDSKIPEEGFSYKCPRCGNRVLFKKGSSAQIEVVRPESVESGGTNPVVQGSYAGAIGGLGCAIPSVMMTLLGIGFLSLGMEVSGYSAAGTILMALLKMLSTGVLIGISLAFIGAKTEIDVWSIWGGLIGTFIGGVIGLISGIFIGTVMGGVLGIAVVFGSVLAWTFKALLVSAVVILVRKYALSSDDEGPLSAPLSSGQMGAVGVLFFLMVFTIVMEMKGQNYAKAALEQTKQEMSSEGLTVTGQEKSYNSQGDLVVTGKIANNSKDDKTGWLVVAELKDGSGAVIRKATLMNGVQMHSMKDMEILKKRGQNIQRPNPGEPGRAQIIKSGETVPFEIAFLDPPSEYNDLALRLKNIDQESMKEILMEGMEGLKGMRK